MFAGQAVEHHGDDDAAHAVVGDAEGFAGDGVIVLAESVLDGVGNGFVANIRGVTGVAILGKSCRDLVIRRRPHIAAPERTGFPSAIRAHDSWDW